MGSGEPPGDFDIHKFFKNPQSSGLNPPLSGLNPPQNPYPRPGTPYNNFPISGSYNASTGTYPNLSASYPFVSQGLMYPQYPQYPQYQQYAHEQGALVPPYPAPGFSHPGFSSQMAQSLNVSSLHQSVNLSNPSPGPSPSPTPTSTPALDSARLMALLTNQSATKGVSSSVELRALDSQTADVYPKVSQFPVSVIPSAPPVSLAPVSTRLASNKIPKGRHLTGEYIVYDIDTRLPGEAQPQLEASTITKYISDPQLLLGRQIAVNSSYICYGLRTNRQIRVLNINNALRSLLRGHSERVTDMSFFSQDVHLFASASSDGRVFVRRIDELPGEDKKLQITDHILLAIQFTGNWESVHPRICWRADSSDVLVVGINKYIITIDIERVRQTAAPSGFVAEEPVFCNVTSPIDGIYCSSEHEDEITDISSCHQRRALLASASKDGTVRLWTDRNMFLCSKLLPHSGSPVGAVTFLSPSHHSDHIVLVTAGPLNRELKLWVPSCEEGWFPASGSINWKCIQTLEFQSARGVPYEESFFNQVLVVSRASLILLANAKRNALYAVHVDYGSNPSSTRMDYLAEFSVTMPILSITATDHDTSSDDEILHFYCVQPQAIQQYSLDISLCAPLLEAPDFAYDNNIKTYNAKLPVNSQPSAATEVSSMLKEQSPGAISGNILTEKSVSESPFSSVSVEPTSSDGSVLSGFSKKELETHEIPLNVPTVVAPIPHVGPATSSPRNLLPAKSVVKSPKLSDSPGEQEYVRVFEQNNGELKNEPDVSIPNSYPLSPKRPSNEIMRISEDTDWQVISTTASSSSGTSERHLVTPFELMSMAARMKGESEGIKIAPPAEGPNIITELMDSGSKIEDYIEKVDLDVLTVETKEVTDSNLLYTDDISMGNNLIVSDLRREVNIVDRLHFETSNEPEESMREDQLSTEPVLDEQGEQLKEVSVKIDDTSTLSVASRSRKKKNKNKTDANTSMAMMIPHSDISESAGNTSCEQGSADLLSSTTFPSSIAAQINTLQDSLNQLVIMQRESQKQMANLIAIPVAKEVKTMEVTLGQRMEKLLKEHVDEIMVHLQEDNTKRENMERERTEQMTTLISNILNKDMPAAFEKSAKKELASIGSSIARYISPTIEKAISTAVTETFQKSISEKAINQLDKSVGGKIETILGKQLQTQFQTYGLQALQDGLASSLEASIIPAFERACQEMFGQVDATFQKGLSEYQMHVQKQVVSSHSVLTTALQEAITSVTSIAATMKDEISNGQKKLLTLIENAGVARSIIPDKAMTVEHVEESLDPTKELARLVSEGKLEEAFNKALSRTDVGIVSWLCNQVDLAAMCTMSPPPLSQGVLLSLVQQLGCDLGQDTGKKLMWIKDAALALNPHDPALAPHMRRFLEQLYSNLHALAKTPLTPELANSTRLVMHVVHSLLSVCK